TSPMPPTPTMARISYDPSRFPAESGIDQRVLSVGFDGKTTRGILSTARWQRSVQVGRLPILRVPGPLAHVRPRLDPPTLGRTHVDVLVAAVAVDGAGPAHAELHQVDPALRALGRRGDLVVQHQVAPARPRQRGLAALRAAADELSEGVAALREHA